MEIVDELKEEANKAIETLKSKFNLNFDGFHWKKACCNTDGTPSAALFICFWFGISLIWMTFVVSLLMIINAFYKITVDFTIVFAFIGTQMAAVFLYLFNRKKSDNNVTIQTTNGTN